MRPSAKLSRLSRSLLNVLGFSMAGLAIISLLTSCGPQTVSGTFSGEHTLEPLRMGSDTSVATFRDTYDFTSSGVVNHEQFQKQKWSGSGLMAGYGGDFKLTHKCVGSYTIQGKVVTVQAQTVPTEDGGGGYNVTERLNIDGSDLLLPYSGGERFVRLTR